MSYYFAKRIASSDLDDVEDKVRGALKDQGFGVLTEIDVEKTLKEKIGAEFHSYRILGACNPKLAHKALQADDKIGTMLPCNVIIRKHGPDEIEVAAVDPVVSMQAVDNPALADVAETVRDRLQTVIDGL